jgi:LysM repeat protein
MLMALFALLGMSVLSAVNYQTHTVRKGDNLYNLAKRYGVTVDEIRNLNSLQNNRLDIGQELKIRAESPITDTKKKSPPKTSEPPKPTTTDNLKKSTSGIYIVKKGDILGEIAKLHGMTVTELKNLNNLRNNRIDVGQKLMVTAESVKPPQKKTPEPELQTVKKQETREIPSGEALTYKVKRRDNLGKIAKQYGLTVDELKALNNLTSTRLDVGQILKVSSSASEPVRKQAYNPEPDTKIVPNKQYAEVSNTVSYTVKKKDNLGKIAKQFGMTLDELKLLNGLSASSFIREGQFLRVKAPKITPNALADTTITSITTKTKKSGKKTYEEVTVDETYTVKRNDSLSKIAKKYGLTAQEIKKHNKLKSNSLRIGQKLKIRTVERRPIKNEEGVNLPPGATAVTDTSTAAKQVRPLTAEELPEEYIYVVKSKDNLYRIALNNGLQTEELLKYNGFASEREVVRVGQKVIIKDPAPYLAALSGTNARQTGTAYTVPDSTIIEKVYIVQRKDTLFKIARENGITVEELKKINNLTSNRISTGQKLYIIAPANGMTKPEKMEPIVSEEDLKTKSVLRTDLIMPVDGKVISQYGIRNGRPHKGIDLGASNGMPVFAVLNGTVVYSGLQGNYGNVVVVEHPDYVMTVYAHNEKNLVSVGDIVKQGQILATVGSTGNATAPHVHFEYRIKGKAINPNKVLPLNK